MRRVLFVATTILATITFSLSPTAVTQQLGGDKLPNPADYSAGTDCKSKSRLQPSVTTPERGTTSQFRCVLSFYNCELRKTEIYTSDEHGPVARCESYWARAAELQEREVCCDKLDCTPPEPISDGPNWFDTTYRCKELQPTKVTHRVVGAKCEIKYSACGSVVYTIRSSVSMTPASCEHWASGHETKFPSRVCCDRWREATKPGSPCNPLADADCDGRPNAQDGYVNESMNYELLPGAPIDEPPRGLSFGEMSPTEPCEDCKWVLTKGKLNCSSGPDQPHNYVATWKCPKTGGEISTVKTAPATVPCK
jgi:hypothetical protein